jgi:hypothetical protein
VVGCARNALTFFILTKDDGARSAASQKPDYAEAEGGAILKRVRHLSHQDQ